MNSVHIRFGVAAEKAQLEALQRRASHALEDYRATLLAHPESVELPAVQLEEQRIRVAELDSKIVGFSVLSATVSEVCELDGLFVDPDYWRRGIGSQLLADALNEAKRHSARAVVVTANPQAEGFYAKLGFKKTGLAETQFGPAARMRIRV